MGKGILKKRAKKAESKAGQGLGLIVEKFLGLGGFERLQIERKKTAKKILRFFCLKHFILKIN